VTFSVKPDRDLTIYDDVKKSHAVDPGKFEVQIGAWSEDIRAKASLAVQYRPAAIHGRRRFDGDLRRGRQP
jgi:hypothetical protein